MYCSVHVKYKVFPKDFIKPTLWRRNACRGFAADAATCSSLLQPLGGAFNIFEVEQSPNCTRAYLEIAAVPPAVRLQAAFSI